MSLVADGPAVGIDGNHRVNFLTGSTLDNRQIVLAVCRADNNRTLTEAGRDRLIASNHNVGLLSRSSGSHIDMQPIYAWFSGKVVVGSNGNLLCSGRLAFECEVVRIADDIGHNRVNVRTVFTITLLNDGD